MSRSSILWDEVFISKFFRWHKLLLTGDLAKRLKYSYAQKLFQNCVEKFIQEQGIFCYEFIGSYDRYHLHHFNFFMGKGGAYL